MQPVLEDAAEFVVLLGGALVESGAPVDQVERLILEVSDRYGLEFGFSVLPTGLIALGRDGTSTAATITAAAPATYRLDQVSSLFDLVDEARAGQVVPADGIRRVHEITTMAPHFGPVITLIGHVALAVGLAMLLQPEWVSLGLVAVLGLGVGLAKLACTGRATMTRLLPVFAAFGVGLVVFGVRRLGADIDGLKVLVPPLVTFLPGAVLTVGAIELTSGSIVAGSSRVIAGGLQLLLLSLGIIVAQSVLNMPAAESLVDANGPHLGWWAPWLGVLPFGLGAAVHLSASTRTFPALVIVLYAAFVAQVAAEGLLGSYISGFVAALVAVTAASLLRRHADGPPVLVTFLPAFWLMVPGVLTLIGVTRVAVGETAADDITTAFYIVLAIALGVIAGLGLDRQLQDRFTWW